MAQGAGDSAAAVAAGEAAHRTDAAPVRCAASRISSRSTRYLALVSGRLPGDRPRWAPTSGTSATISVRPKRTFRRALKPQYARTKRHVTAWASPCSGRSAMTEALAEFRKAREAGLHGSGRILRARVRCAARQHAEADKACWRRRQRPRRLAGRRRGGDMASIAGNGRVRGRGRTAWREAGGLAERCCGDAARRGGVGKRAVHRAGAPTRRKTVSAILPHGSRCARSGCRSVRPCRPKSNCWPACWPRGIDDRELVRIALAAGRARQRRARLPDRGRIAAGGAGRAGTAWPASRKPPRHAPAAVGQAGHRAGDRPIGG